MCGGNERNRGECLRADEVGVTEDTKIDERHCFKCGRDLGPLLERKKMDTEAGPICYVCYNEAAGDRRREEQPR